MKHQIFNLANSHDFNRFALLKNLNMFEKKSNIKRPFTSKKNSSKFNRNFLKEIKAYENNFNILGNSKNNQALFNNHLKQQNKTNNLKNHNLFLQNRMQLDKKNSNDMIRGLINNNEKLKYKKSFNLDSNQLLNLKNKSKDSKINSLRNKEKKIVLKDNFNNEFKLLKGDNYNNIRRGEQNNFIKIKKEEDQIDLEYGLNKKLEILQQEINQKECENKNLKKENIELFENLQKLKQELEKEKEKNDKNHSLITEVDILRKENKVLKEKEKERENLILEEIKQIKIKEKEKEKEKGKEKEKEKQKLKLKKNNEEKLNLHNYDEEIAKIKEKEINENKKEYETKKAEIDKRIEEIKKREEEFNKRVAFYEDKEAQLEQENEKNENIKKQFKDIKKENNFLMNKNKELNNQMNELKLKYKLKLNNSPMKLFKKPTLIGLNNIGATCYMNATLQCLSQTKGLSNYFLKEINKEKIINNNIAKNNKNENQLSPVYSELIHNLWDINGNKSFDPTNFMNKITEMNPLFKKGQPGDSKDFIIFILEQIHKELKTPIKNKNIVLDKPLNQYDKNNALNYFISEFQENCSVISDIFFGIIETTNECLNCRNNNNSQNNPICYNYQIFNCLIFPLEEVRKMSYNSRQNYTNVVSLYDCFNYYQKTELFTGENRNYCNICKQLFESNYTSKIYLCPNSLILILNRGKGNIFDVKLNFSEIVDVTPFAVKKDYPLIIYSLYGVITHIGESGPNAHFVASCKSSIDHKWYRYNDSLVSPITNIQKEVIDFGIPYILFYQKNKIK